MLEGLEMCWKVWGCVGRFGDVLEGLGMCWKLSVVQRLFYIQSGAKRTHVFESACDFFLWGYLKSKVYVRKPRTVNDLEVSIREEIATVPQEMLVNVMQNFEERFRTCLRQEGHHLSHIIFRN